MGLAGSSPFGWAVDLAGHLTMLPFTQLARVCRPAGTSNASSDSLVGAVQYQPLYINAEVCPGHSCCCAALGCPRGAEHVGAMCRLAPASLSLCRAGCKGQTALLTVSACQILACTLLPCALTLPWTSSTACSSGCRERGEPIWCHQQHPGSAKHHTGPSHCFQCPHAERHEVRTTACTPQQSQADSGAERDAFAQGC